MHAEDPFAYYRPLQQVKSFVEENQHRLIRVTELAEVAGMQPNAFCAYCKRIVGEPPSIWLQRCKVEEACRLLVSEDYTILEVAFLLGYSSARPLERAFRKVLEVSPAEWRKRHVAKLAMNAAASRRDQVA